LCGVDAVGWQLRAAGDAADFTGIRSCFDRAADLADLEKAAATSFDWALC
jgi:hypothetical protein